MLIYAWEKILGNKYTHTHKLLTLVLWGRGQSRMMETVASPYF